MSDKLPRVQNVNDNILLKCFSLVQMLKPARVVKLTAVKMSPDRVYTISESTDNSDNHRYFCEFYDVKIFGPLPNFCVAIV